MFFQHKELKCHPENFYLIHMSVKKNQVRKGMRVAIVHCIWEKRNRVVFKQEVPYAEIFFQSTQLLAWFLLKYKVRSFSYAFSDWHLNPNQCIQCIRWKKEVIMGAGSKAGRRIHNNDLESIQQQVQL